MNMNKKDDVQTVLDELFALQEEKRVANAEKKKKAEKIRLNYLFGQYTLKRIRKIHAAIGGETFNESDIARAVVDIGISEMLRMIDSGEESQAKGRTHIAKIRTMLTEE